MHVAEQGRTGADPLRGSDACMCRLRTPFKAPSLNRLLDRRLTAAGYRATVGALAALARCTYFALRSRSRGRARATAAAAGWPMQGVPRASALPSPPPACVRPSAGCDDVSAGLTDAAVARCMQQALVTDGCQPAVFALPATVAEADGARDAVLRLLLEALLSVSAHTAAMSEMQSVSGAPWPPARDYGRLRLT